MRRREESEQSSTAVNQHRTEQHRTEHGEAKQNRVEKSKAE